MQRILVIDNDIAVADIYSRILSHEGYRVDITHDGSTAVAHLRQNRVGLVLSDFNYPCRGEVEAHLKLHPDLPVIVATGNYEVEEVCRMAREGLNAREVLPKPTPLADLIAAVRKHYKDS